MLITFRFAKRQLRAVCAARRSTSICWISGAVMGEIAGWERANWFANEGQKPEYEYSWKRQNFFDNVAAEHNAVRNNVGMYDMTSFGKLRVEGRDAMVFMNYIGGGDYDVPVGKIVYTQFLNSCRDRG